MSENTYRLPGKLDTSIEVKVEKSVADALRIMAEHTKVSQGEIVNTAMKRFIATHSDYLPKPKKQVAS